MRAKKGFLQSMAYLAFGAAAAAIAISACGGGGGGTTSSTAPPGVAGPAAVSIALGSAADYPAGTTFATSTLSPTEAAPANSPTFDNVFVWVTKVALIPGSGVEYPDGNGEMEQANSAAENGKSGAQGFVTIPLEKPVRIDLLHPPSGSKVAWLLNRFAEVPVPAGEYSKIRVYYDNVVGHNGPEDSGDDTRFHPTANYHFDVHFVRGNLVIPETAPQGGIRFYEIVIDIVGLKYHQAGNSGNVLLRPQIFAEFVPPVLYGVKGTADNVAKTAAPDPVSGSFDLAYGASAPVHVTFDGVTGWSYSDNVLARSDWKILGVPNRRAADSFENRAEVLVIGSFDGGVFQARDILFTFPDVVEGAADNVWLPPDDAAFLIPSADNVAVFPLPDPATAYYDDLVTPGSWDAAFPPLAYTALDNNLPVRARGYYEGIDLEGNETFSAYWISIGVVPAP
jgi:hypothetical protein